MSRKLALACLSLAAALALGVTAAFAGTVKGGSDPGLTSTSILLGGTSPLSGPASAYASVARGADAYFRYVNARGGVLGRTISYKVVDDAYNPAQTVQATRQLVEQEKVFAVFNSVGTEQGLAVRDYLNTAKVPQLFVASGATTWGRDYTQYPYTIGFQPSYQAEGWVYGKYLARTAPGARVAVLFQNDDYGKDLLGGLKKGLQRSAAKVIAAQPYEATAPDVASQMARLKASGADTLAIFATPKFAVQAFALANKLGWKPKRVINNAVSSASNVMERAAEGGNKVVNGALSIVFLKDPTDPQWSSDAAMKLYAQIMKKYAPGANADDVYHVYGMAVAWTAVEALKKAGKDLSRASLLKAVDALNAPGNPFLLPGIAVKTAGDDHFPVEQMVLQRWQKGSWRSFGGLWGYRAS
jgi:branched-chain amino acid transport system substrate-binding protein